MYIVVYGVLCYVCSLCFIYLYCVQCEALDLVMHAMYGTWNSTVGKNVVFPFFRFISELFFLLSDFLKNLNFAIPIPDQPPYDLT